MKLIGLPDDEKATSMAFETCLDDTCDYGDVQGG